MVVTTESAHARRLLDDLGLELSAVTSEPENAEYGAVRARVGRGAIRFRTGKLTPKKSGLFVTAWRRAEDGTTAPHASEDGINLLVVEVREGERLGQFVFPTAVLAARDIVSTGGRGGKRGFRVYPPWSATTSRQAARTQQWQCEHFLDLEQTDLARARALYTDYP